MPENKNEKIDKNDRIRVYEKEERPDPERLEQDEPGSRLEQTQEELDEGEVATDRLGEQMGEEYLRQAVTGDGRPDPEASPRVVSSTEKLSMRNELPDDAELGVETNPSAVEQSS